MIQVVYPVSLSNNNLADFLTHPQRVPLPFLFFLVLGPLPPPPCLTDLSATTPVVGAELARTSVTATSVTATATVARRGALEELFVLYWVELCCAKKRVRLM